MTLKTESLYFTYSNQQSPVLNDINMSFHRNKIYLLLGPSGCGKSSFVNILAGIIPNNITGELIGEVTIDGESIIGKGSHEIASKVGYVMQDPDTQFCTYKVEDELLFSLENFKYSREDMDRRIENVLDILDIRHLRYRVLNTLSGGQKQKVAIGSILTLDPPILIFDEPTANLDPATSKEVFETIKMLQEELNKTIIIIEHKLDYLIEYVDYVYILGSDGYMLKEGNPKEVFEDIDIVDSKPSFHYPQVIDLWRNLKLPYEDIRFNIREVGEYLKENYSYIEEKATQSHNDDDKNVFLSALNISYSVVGKKIIDDLNFSVNKGDFLAITGPNGAGKSTIAAILVNLHKDYKGKVLLDNKSIKSYNRKDLWKKAGLVFQNPEWQFVSYSVREELEYSLKDLNLNKEEVNKRVEECLKRFKLLEFKEENPYFLSQGQKRRLSVATMLITGQELLILDEPTYGQDYENQVELLEYIKELNLDGMTIIMITHDMDAVIKYCNKVLVLKDGSSIYFGDNRKLFGKDEILQKAKLTKPIYVEILEEMQYKGKALPVNLEEFIDNLAGKERAYDR